MYYIQRVAESSFEADHSVCYFVGFWVFCIGSYIMGPGTYPCDLQLLFSRVVTIYY